MDPIFPEDEGVFECVAKNALGETRSKCRLIVDVPEGSEKQPPVFSTALEPKTVTEGDVCVLECTVTGTLSRGISKASIRISFQINLVFLHFSVFCLFPAKVFVLKKK